jgi:ABC-2 type transport system ATP-binding protein
VARRPRADPAAVASVHHVVEESHTERQTTLLVRVNGHLFDPSWEVRDATLEDIVLGYMSQSPGCQGLEKRPAPEGIRKETLL